MEKLLSFALLMVMLTAYSLAQEFEVKSPSGAIAVKVVVSDKVTYRVDFNGKAAIQPSAISMTLDNGIILGDKAKLQKKEMGSRSEIITPSIPRKFSKIEASFNYLRLRFKGDYLLEFRAYNDGIAYRWETTFKNDIKVMSEQASFTFAEGDYFYFPEEESMHSHQERLYKHLKISEIEAGRFCSTGALADLQNGLKVYISEADLFSYPGMFLERSSSNPNGFQGKFAGYPLQTEQTNDRNVKITKYADYIARVKDTRSFPWRLMIIADNDADLVSSELVYKLASPSRLGDVSWIKPGKVAWDWWNANNIYGVDFKSGINNDTYKYYIDFASKYGIEYIILDEGWYPLEDVTRQVDGINVKELVDYGKQRNVGIILWVTWKGLDDRLDEALTLYQSWGVRGVKVDFMQRDDQWMVEYYERIARKAAEHHMLVDFHGAYKPTGFNVTYPNIITSEGVHGLENCKWAETVDPEHNVTLPFIRMVAGPMDYTPGAMINANKRNFRIVWSEPMSPTTRCQQLAMYVVYESPLQMLADNPSNYLKEPVCMEFLSAVPSTWDETKVLSAKVADYIVLARRKRETWYLGAMTDWTPRDFEIDLSFLPEESYHVDIWQDGVNAEKHAADFKKVSQTISNKSKINIHLAPGGGWVAIVRPVK